VALADRQLMAFAGLWRTGVHRQVNAFAVSQPLFLTFPTRWLTGQHVISSDGVWSEHSRRPVGVTRLLVKPHRPPLRFQDYRNPIVDLGAHLVGCRGNDKRYSWRDGEGSRDGSVSSRLLPLNRWREDGGKIILITTVGNDDPRFSGLFEVVLLTPSMISEPGPATRLGGVTRLHPQTADRKPSERANGWGR